MLIKYFDDLELLTTTKTLVWQFCKIYLTHLIFLKYSRWFNVYEDVFTYIIVKFILPTHLNPGNPPECLTYHVS